MNDIKIGQLYQHTPTGIVRRVLYVGKNYVVLQNNSNYSRCLIKDFLKFWKPYEAPNTSDVSNDKVLELPFKVGDNVWFIVSNEVHEGTLTECNITIDQDDTQICYNVLYYNRIHCQVEAKGIASSKLFKTKEELLKSL